MATTTFLLFSLFYLSMVATNSVVYPGSIYYDPVGQRQLMHYPSYYYQPTVAGPQQLEDSIYYIAPTSPAVRARPFFNLLSNVCQNVLHVCPSCPTCPTCPAAPTCAAAPPSTASLTTCGSMTASPGGTFAIPTDFTTGSGSPTTCTFGVVIYPPNTKVIVTCSNIANGLTFSPAATPSGGAVANTPYTVTGNAVMTFASLASTGNKPSCTWTTSP